MPKLPTTIATSQVGVCEAFERYGKEFPAPFWMSEGGGAVLYHGHVVDQLARLPARSVHCCVTSPPYYALRDYGCSGQIGMEPLPDCGTHGQAQCGDCFVCSMVAVFREVRRVLRDDGTCWLNLGSSYGDGGNELMIPARVAIALNADGWILRQDIIWYSPNKMPESVENRCTKSHEHIFLLAKSEGYYYDNEAIKEKAKSEPHAPGNRKLKEDNGKTSLRNDTNELSSNTNVWAANGYVNKRDVWVVSTRGYPGTHFATYPPQLIEPCILAGTSEHGCCAECGAQYERIVVRSGAATVEPDADGRDRSIASNRNGITGSLDGVPATSTTVGWRKVCACDCADVAPCTVLDPFMGSGTTAATAIQHGRRGIGVDLNEKYLRENAIPRIEAAISGEKVGRKSTAKLLAGPKVVAAKPMVFGRKMVQYSDA